MCIVVAATVTASGAGAGAAVDPFDATAGYDHVSEPPPGALSAAEWCFSFTDPTLAGSTVTLAASGPTGTVTGAGLIGPDLTAKVRVGITQGGRYEVTSAEISDAGPLDVRSVPAVDVVFDPMAVDCRTTLRAPPPTTLPPSTTATTTAAPTATTPTTAATTTTAPAPPEAASADSGWTPWWILVGLGILVILAGAWILGFPAPVPDPAEPGGPPDGGTRIALEPPVIPASDPGDPPRCDWGAKYATVVDSTYGVGEADWRHLRRPVAAECARYEVTLASTLVEVTPDAEHTEDKQVSYSRLVFWKWWELIRHVRRWRTTVGSGFTSHLRVQASDPRDPDRKTSKLTAADVPGDTAPAVRSTSATLSGKVSHREVLFIRVKLEPGPETGCYPGGARRTHEFWGAGGTTATGVVEWRCAHSAQYMLFASCGNAAPRNPGPPPAPGLAVTLGGRVRCQQLPTLNYELVSANDPAVSESVTSDDPYEARLVLDPKVTVDGTAGPFRLGTFTLGPGTDHPESLTRSVRAAHSRTGEVQTADEVVVTADAHVGATASVISTKGNNWNQTVTTDLTGRIHHWFHLIGRTDPDAPCPCCRPGIEVRVGDPGTIHEGGSGAHATVRVGGTVLELAHPGWRDGDGWAPAGTTRAWRIVRVTDSPAPAGTTTRPI